MALITIRLWLCWSPVEAFYIHLQVLLWDEPFNSEEIGNVGVVGTNDEITRTFFSNTKVQVEFISPALEHNIMLWIRMKFPKQQLLAGKPQQTFKSSVHSGVQNKDKARHDGKPCIFHFIQSSSENQWVI